MREIKFRAWDRNRKVMFWFNPLWGNWGQGDGWIGAVPWGEELKNYGMFKSNKGGIDSDDCDFMQFTGLKDKNGKEIYEGDVVRIHNYKTEWKHGEPPGDWRVFKVWYNRYTWSLKNEWISTPLSDYNLRTLEDYKMEVIGNIYENPELLENK